MIFNLYIDIYKKLHNKQGPKIVNVENFTFTVDWFSLQKGEREKRHLFDEFNYDYLSKLYIFWNIYGQINAVSLKIQSLLINSCNDFL